MSKVDEEKMKKQISALAAKLRPMFLRMLDFIDTEVRADVDPNTNCLDSKLKELRKECEDDLVLVTRIAAVIGSLFRDDKAARFAQSEETLQKMPESLQKMHSDGALVKEGIPTLREMIDACDESMQQIEYHNKRKRELGNASHDAKINHYEQQLAERCTALYFHLIFLLKLMAKTMVALVDLMPAETAASVKELAPLVDNLDKIKPVAQIKLARYFLVFSSVVDEKLLK